MATVLKFLPLIAEFLILFSLIVLRAVRPAFAYAWLVAVLGTLISWLMLIAFRTSWAAEISLLGFGPSQILPAGLLLRFDEISWGYSLALVTILLSTLLTSPAVANQSVRSRPAWKTLLSAVALTILAMIGVTAGNLLTLMMIMGFSLLLEILTWISIDRVFEETSLIPASGLQIRLAVLALLLWGTIAAVQSDPELRFAGLAEPAPILLILAAGLRLGVFPPVLQPQSEKFLPELLHPILFISTCAPALLLLTRVAEGGSLISAIWVWIILAALAVIGSGASLISTPGRNAVILWMAGSSAFVVVAGLSQVQSAAMAWGMTCLLAGSFFLQYRNRSFLLRALAVITLLSLTSLPYTSTWAGAKLFSSPKIIWIFFLLGQSMLVVAFFRFFRIRETGAHGSDRVLRLIYIIGMAVLPLTWIALSLLPFLSNPDQQNALMQLDILLPGLVVVGLSLIVMFFFHIWPIATSRLLSLVGDIVSLKWLVKILIRLASLARSLLSLLNFLLEAQAGIIWAFLFIILLLTLIVQVQPGG